MHCVYRRFILFWSICLYVLSAFSRLVSFSWYQSLLTHARPRFLSVGSRIKFLFIVRVCICFCMCNVCCMAFLIFGFLLR